VWIFQKLIQRLSRSFALPPIKTGFLHGCKILFTV
jgi:hypothetical protein